MEYLGTQELPGVVITSGSAHQPISCIRTLPAASATAMFQMTASDAHDELNDDSELKKSYFDRAGEDDSITLSTSSSPSRSRSPSPSHSPSPMWSLQRTALDKPLGQLTEEDIMHLTREDCRRYLKEKGMRRPSWNKSQAIQQVLSLKGLFDDKDDKVKGFKPRTCPTSIIRDSSFVTEVSNPQQTRLAFNNAHNMPQVISHQSSHMVGFEINSAPCKAPQRDADDDNHATQRPNTSQLTCSYTPVVDIQSINLHSYPGPLDPVTATPRPLKGNSLQSHHGYSQCAQSSGLAEMAPSAQLTIFYSGMVNVYENVPADKAEAVMLLAAHSNAVKPSFHSHVQSLSNIPVSAQNTTLCYSSTPQYVHSSLAMTELPLITTSPSVPIPFSLASNAIQSEQQPSRKASLQRYLEKRRGRNSVRTPYPASIKGAEGDSSNHCMLGRYKLFEMMGQSVGFPYHASYVPLPTQSSGSETSAPHIPLGSSS